MILEICQLDAEDHGLLQRLVFEENNRLTKRGASSIDDFIEDLTTPGVLM